MVMMIWMHSGTIAADCQTLALSTMNTKQDLNDAVNTAAIVEVPTNAVVDFAAVADYAVAVAVDDYAVENT